MTIGQLAKATGLPTSAINFYVEAGLLTPNERTKSGYRKFDDTAIETIKLIRQLKKDRFSIKEIRQAINRMGGI